MATITFSIQKKREKWQSIPVKLSLQGKSENLEKRKRVRVHEDLEGKTKQKHAEHRILKK